MKAIAFCHIPKTGGTSIHRMLSRWAGSREITEQLKSANYSDAVRAWDHLCVISGHFWFKPGETLDTRRLNFTLLRDPIDRLLSNYYYVRSQDPTFHPSAPERSLDLYAYAASELPSVQSTVDNFQTRLLAPLGLSSDIVEPTQSDLLSAAIRSLDSFDLVGIFPELGDTADLAACLARVVTNGELPHERVTEGRALLCDIPDDVRKQLARRNELDLALYSHAVQRFKQQRRQVFIASSNRLVAQEIPPRAIAQEDSESPLVHARAAVASTSRGSTLKSRFGNGAIEIVAVRVHGEISLGSGTVMAGETVTISVHIAAHVSTEELVVGIHIHDSSDRLVFGTNSYLHGRKFSVSDGSLFEARFSFRNVLGIGSYRVGVSLHTGVSHLVCCYDWQDNCASINVAATIGYHFEGSVFLDLSTDLSSIRGSAPKLCDTTTSQHLVILARHNPVVSNAVGEIRLLSDISRMRSGDLVSIEVEIESCCGQTLECSGMRPVRVSYRWLDAPGKQIIQQEGIRTNLGIDVHPSETRRAWITVVPPPEFIGHATLRVVPVQENVGWFDELGTFYRDTSVTIHA